ncbi:DUF805 domain-containing protein [Litoreibacter ascidiaceicola]|nr:DUF805 domain-containing protein [Litoreibacter ascidiaceicola]
MKEGFKNYGVVQGRSSRSQFLRVMVAFSLLFAVAFSPALWLLFSEQDSPGSVPALIGVGIMVLQISAMFVLLPPPWCIALQRMNDTPLSFPDTFALDLPFFKRLIRFGISYWAGLVVPIVSAAFVAQLAVDQQISIENPIAFALFFVPTALLLFLPSEKGSNTYGSNPMGAVT